VPGVLIIAGLGLVDLAFTVILRPLRQCGTPRVATDRGRGYADGGARYRSICSCMRVNRNFVGSNPGPDSCPESFTT
jgi:hypothetical protein